MSKRSILRAIRGKQEPLEPLPEWGQVVLLVAFIALFVFVMWLSPNL